MNLLYTLAWRGAGAETNARDLYQQLRAATVRGERIPFDCPYEAALANQRSMDGEWIVAILVMRGGILGDTERTETIVKLEDWFARSGAAGMRGGQTHPADHLKVASELGLGYAVVESFGTFVGEPEDADKKKPVSAAAEKSEPATAEVEAPDEPIISPEVTAPPSTREVIAAASQSANGCANWGGGIAIAAGVIVGLAGLLVALLVVIVQFTEESPTSDIGDFFLIMACFPLPMLIFAIVMIGVGILVLRRARKQTAAALSLS